MEAFWIIFYFLYVSTSIRFFLHTGILAFPIPRKARRRVPNNDLILIQYPIRNEPLEVIQRFFKSLWTIPEEQRGRYLLQVLDDYDRRMAWVFQSPIKVQYLKRPKRWGNKAGNLNYGLALAHKAYRWVMIYDSDHQVDGTRIAEAVEMLAADDKLACVQSRWVMNNLASNALSWCQQAVIGPHLEREQTFSSYCNLYPIFNGAGAVWNRSIVQRECNGWLERCVCEDTDISGVMNMRGYQIHVLSTWTTRIDNVTAIREFRKQQKRWIKGNGQQMQFHAREKAPWTWKRLYWMSWNVGFALAFTKYLIPPVMAYKGLSGIGFNWVDYLCTMPHLFAWIGSIQTWDNRLDRASWKRFLLYPAQYVLEHIALDNQIKGFWHGFWKWNHHHEFEVTKKG